MAVCCSPFESAADQQFNSKKVAVELANFRKKGPGPTTRLLEEGIATTGALSGVLLDIGCGIGSLTFALLERGITRAVCVDASAAYIGTARKEAQRRGHVDAIQFVHADFVSVASQLPVARVVTLDRVVCCYPSDELLLDAALTHADYCFALSYPRDVWYIRFAMMAENGRRWLARNTFRTFVHPVANMRERTRRAGFELLSRRETWIWVVDVYIRRPVEV